MHEIISCEASLIPSKELSKAGSITGEAVCMETR